MSCRICKRLDCTESFHSIPDQREFDASQEATRVFPEGCMCGNNGGGDCEWCLIYYSVLEES